MEKPKETHYPYVLATCLLDFNLGHRETILIGEKDLDRVLRPHVKYKAMGTHYLVSTTPRSINLFKAIMQKSGNIDVALGRALGYPPRCVEWFASTTMEEHMSCGTLTGGSYAFKCPTELIDYAIDFMLTMYNVSMYYDIDVEDIMLIDTP